MEGVPEAIDTEQYLSLVDALDEFCVKYRNKIAFTNFGSSINYFQLREYSFHLAAFLQQDLKLKPGARVAIMLPNTLQYPISLFGILRAGLIVVNINPLYTPRELAFELEHSGAETLIILENYAHLLESIIPEIKLENIIITKIGDLLGALTGVFFNFTLKYIKRAIPTWKIPKVQFFKNALKKGASLVFTPCSIQLKDVAFLQLTGGTTGIPKAVVLTHQNMIANLCQCVDWVRGKLKMGEETLLICLPLYHIFSLTVDCFTFLALGGRGILITDPRDLQRLIKSWRKFSPTCLIGVNTLFAHLMENSKFQALDFNKFKLTVSGGMATNITIAERWQKLTGQVIIEGYGLTEASPVVTINPLDISYFNQSVGLPIPNTQIKICDEKGTSLPVDEIGELWVKGPQVMREYWENFEETRAVLDKEGWLKTGDIARIDAEGFVFLIDRKKDLIIVSGFNVYPNEVEAIIAQLPGVLEVAVIGVKNEHTGETIKAFIVKKDQKPEANDVITHCHHFLTSYKVPREIEFIDKLPKSAVGKVLRRQLS